MTEMCRVKNLNYSDINSWNQTLMLYISVLLWDFTLDFTVRDTYQKLGIQIDIILNTINQFYIFMLNNIS